jgi:hypothetical protein
MTTDVRGTLAALHAESPEADLDRAAETLAVAAAPSRQPRKAVAALLRHHMPARCPDWVCEAVRRKAHTFLDHQSSGSTTPDTDAGWSTTGEAARILRVRERELRTRLKARSYRQGLGWPWWTGTRWLVPTAALKPGSRAAFINAQPDEEPHPGLLPEWCDRE